MGCVPSKEDAEGGAESRCRERKHLLRDAVAARHALAGAHAGHAAALRNVGAALSDYAAGGTDAAAVIARSASAPGGAAAAKALPPPPPLPLEPVLPPPPPLPPGADADAAPLVRSLSAPDLPVAQTIRKKPSGEAAAIIEEEEDEAEGDADADALRGRRRRRARDDDDVPAPPPPPPNIPPPARSPPPVPSRGTEEEEEAKPAPQANSWDEFIFGSRDVPPPPPTLDPGAAEASWAAERRDPGPTPPPPPEAEHRPPPPQPAADEVAEGKKPVEEPVVRRAATQKAARKPEGKKARAVVMAPPQPPTLGDVLRKLDDHFLKASESAHEVSKMLEAARMHYHSNFAETRGFVDHSARVMQVITWNRSFKGIPQPENVKNELDDDEWETHATVLDKLLAWEKKLYHEVKEFEVIKMTYQRKLAVLNKKKQRGASSSSVEKTKALVSHLHTKFIVDLQTMESTVAEINRLRDKQLYPKLLELVKGMGHMWDIMYAHHKAQLRIISDLKSSDIPVAVRETSEQHHERTVQLWNIVQEWHTLFGNFMTFQKDYVGSLYSWIKLNVIPIDTNLKPNSSQPHETTPPIKRLLHAWHDILQKLPDESTKKAIFTFAEVVKTIIVHQEEELQLRIKIQETRREHERKRRQFDDWARKNWDAGMNNPDGSLAAPVVERKAAVERLEQAVKNMEEEYVKKCRTVRDKSLNLLRSNLPELFRVVSDFSLQSAGMFKGLWSIAHTNDQLDD